MDLGSHYLWNLIVYEVREREHHVEILRFLHGAQIN
jgi:hypothetical protein